MHNVFFHKLSGTQSKESMTTRKEAFEPGHTMGVEGADEVQLPGQAEAGRPGHSGRRRCRRGRHCPG